MTINTAFDLLQAVQIIEISTPAIVREIRISLHGVSYLTTYWWEGKMQEVWLTEMEISK